MPYRTVPIGNGEYTIARVPDEVVEEWKSMRVRYSPGTAQYQRPPDVDTPEFRSWVRIVDPKEIESYKNSTPPLDFLVYAAGSSLVVGGHEYGGKALITYRNDEKTIGYEYRIKVTNETQDYVVMDKSFHTEDWDEEAYIAVLDILHATFIAPKGRKIAKEDPIISTYFDFIELIEETNLAYEELKAWQNAQN